MSENAPHPGTAPLFTRNFVRLLVAQACFGYAFSSFFMLPKFLVTALGAGPVEIGWVASAYGAAVIVFLPASGIMVDRFGRRIFLVGGALLMAAASIAFATVDSIGPAIYLLRGVQGIAFAMAFIGGSTIAVDEAPPERVGQAIALFGLMMLAMNGVAAAGVEALSSAAGWPAAFGLAAASATLCALLARGLTERTVLAPEPDDGNLLQVVTRPSLVPMWIGITAVGAAMSSMVTYHQPFAIELGFANVSGFFVAYSGGAILVRIGLGHFIDRAGRRRVAIGSAAFYTLVVASMAHLGSELGLACMGLGLGVAHGFFYPASNSLAIEGVSSGERGKVMALFQGGFHVGFAGSALGFGWLAESAGYPPVFYGGAACALLALAAMLYARPEPKPVLAQAEVGAHPLSSQAPRSRPRSRAGW